MIAAWEMRPTAGGCPVSPRPPEIPNAYWDIYRKRASVITGIPLLYPQFLQFCCRLAVGSRSGTQREAVGLKLRPIVAGA